MKKTVKEKILYAETKANNWLARANELREAGKDDSNAMEKAQHWLDKLNELEENKSIKNISLPPWCAKCCHFHPADQWCEAKENAVEHRVHLTLGILANK